MMTSQKSQELDQRIIEMAKNSGAYTRKYCQIQMLKDEANVRTIRGDPDTRHVRYCRACESSCPVGQ